MVEQTVELEPSESRVVTFEAVPSEARTYNVLVDGLSGSFRAIPLPPPDGRFVIAYAWWEDLADWTQILPSNEWPANTTILTRWKVENTGNETSRLTVEFMGQSGSISLNPGESGSIELTVNSGSLGNYSYTANLYANDVLVDSSTIGVTVLSPLLSYPALEVVTWSWLPHDPPFDTTETIGMRITLRSLSSLDFDVYISAVCEGGAFSAGLRGVGVLQHGEVEEFDVHFTNVWFTTRDTAIVKIWDGLPGNMLDSIRAPFSVV